MYRVIFGKLRRASHGAILNIDVDGVTFRAIYLEDDGEIIGPFLHSHDRRASVFEPAARTAAEIFRSQAENQIFELCVPEFIAEDLPKLTPSSAE